jgi:hypothetical protein
MIEIRATTPERIAGRPAGAIPRPAQPP